MCYGTTQGFPVPPAYHKFKFIPKYGKEVLPEKRLCRSYDLQVLQFISEVLTAVLLLIKIFLNITFSRIVNLVSAFRRIKMRSFSVSTSLRRAFINAFPSI